MAGAAGGVHTDRTGRECLWSASEDGGHPGVRNPRSIRDRHGVDGAAALVLSLSRWKNTKALDVVCGRLLVRLVDDLGLLAFVSAEHLRTRRECHAAVFVVPAGGVEYGNLCPDLPLSQHGKFHEARTAQMDRIRHRRWNIHGY